MNNEENKNPPVQPVEAKDIDWGEVPIPPTPKLFSPASPVSYSSVSKNSFTPLSPFSIKEDTTTSSVSSSPWQAISKEDSKESTVLNLENKNFEKKPIERLEPEIKLGEIPKIKTFKADMTEEMKREGSSMISMVMAETKKREKETLIEEELKISSTKNIFLIILSLIFIIGGILIGIFFLIGGKNPLVPTPVSEKFLILTDDSPKEFDVLGLKKEDIIKRIKNERKNSNAVVGSVTKISFYDTKNTTKHYLTAKEYVSIILPNAPPSLTRTLEDQFVFGLHIYQQNEIYMILKTNYYQNAFAGMLAWEKDMLFDVGKVFFETPIAIENFGLYGFKDAVIANMDSRVVRNLNTKKIIFLYSFIDKETLVMATNENTLREIAERLRTAKLRK